MMYRYHRRLWFRMLVATAMLVVSMLPSIDWQPQEVMAAAAGMFRPARAASTVQAVGTAGRRLHLGLARVAAGLPSGEQIAAAPAVQMLASRATWTQLGHRAGAGLRRLAGDTCVLALELVRAAGTEPRGWERRPHVIAIVRFIQHRIFTAYDLRNVACFCCPITTVP
jgi:hypothetical protein